MSLTDDSKSSGRRKDGLLTTGDMARLSANTLRTVRFYEETGILRPTQRTDGGHRLFPMGELRRLQLVSDLRAAGFSLEEIRDMLDAKERGTTGAAVAQDVVTRLEEQIGSMRERVGLLQRLLTDLEGAREMLESCKKCDDPSRFPENCHHCGVLGTNETRPRAVGVLWGLPIADDQS